MTAVNSLRAMYDYQDSLISLEAKHLIWVWIIKVKGPKNQADFIEVLYPLSRNYVILTPI